MTDNVGAFLLINNQIVENADKRVNFDRYNKVVYEVIRIIGSVPLFWEDHIVRLKKSLSLAGRELDITSKELMEQCRKLLKVNRKSDCNIKLILCEDDGEQICIMYISKSYYPGKNEIENGVKVILLQLERENPNIKLVNHTYKELVSKKIEENKVFEILLVDHDKKITEGSKSNLFFVKGEKVFTAPGEYVLKGITRQYVIEACNRLGIEVIETLINMEDIDEMEGAFISGTSIKVLPISHIDDKKLASAIHPTVASIRDCFDKIIEDYLKRAAF